LFDGRVPLAAVGMSFNERFLNASCVRSRERSCALVVHQSDLLTESSSLEFRFETFYTFNHAQFDGAGSVDGNRDDATFGQILKSQPGRISQVALKLSAWKN
jgi:hypothetical protein